MSKMTNDYVVGLVDGEGSFNVRLNKSQRRRAKVELKFSLKLIHHDKNVLDELHEFFGCGNVYIQRDKRRNHSTCYRYEVQNRQEIMDIIVPFFEENQLRTETKRRDFELFKSITDLLKEKPYDLEKIQSLKEQMH